MWKEESMIREMLKSKIHRATVTDADLNYEGSITIDSVLLEHANILPGEKVQIMNVNNGARFETYTIAGPAGEGDMCINGAAARLAQVGDIILIISYAYIQDVDLEAHQPVIVKVDTQNKMVIGV
jgi:aspartate 1-decarboxylase